MKENGRHGEPCNWSQDCVKHACTARQRLSLASALHLPIELVKRSCWSFPPPEIASLPPFLSCPKTVFPRCPLVAEPPTYPSPADIPELYSNSRVLQTNFGRSHPKKSNWKGRIHNCAHVQVLVLYWEQATDAVWLQISPALRPGPRRKFLAWFFFLLLKLYYFTKANFRSAAPACITCVYQSNEQMRGHDEARRREASVQRSRPEVGRSIYISISIYISWQRRRWPPNWGLAEARPNKMVDESVIGYSADGKDRPIPGHPCTYVARQVFFFKILDSTCAHKWFSNSPRSSLR